VQVPVRREDFYGSEGWGFESLRAHTSERAQLRRDARRV
jgi:hypothetical protein